MCESLATFVRQNRKKGGNAVFLQAGQENDPCRGGCGGALYIRNAIWMYPPAGDSIRRDRSAERVRTILSTETGFNR